MYCLETNNLTHRFTKENTVLKNISLRVTEGSIYGFWVQTEPAKQQR